MGYVCTCEPLSTSHLIGFRDRADAEFLQQTSVGKALRGAWDPESADRAARVLKRLVGSLERAVGAAR